jgi:hypothetical protein
VRVIPLTNHPPVFHLRAPIWHDRAVIHHSYDKNQDIE